MPLAIDEHRMEFEAAVWDVPRRGGYQTVEQVWFPGVHANVGGGCEDKGLSDLTLDWMLKRVRRYCPELALRPVHLEPDHRGVLYEPRTWLYWRSIRRPLIRIINRCPVKRGAQRIRLARGCDRIRKPSARCCIGARSCAIWKRASCRPRSAAPDQPLGGPESAKRGRR